MTDYPYGGWFTPELLLVDKITSASDVEWMDAQDAASNALQLLEALLVLKNKGWKFVPPGVDCVFIALPHDLADKLDDFLHRLAPGTDVDAKDLIREILRKANAETTS